MKALVLEDIGKLTFKDVPMPDVKDDEVLLRIKAAGICNSDIDRVFRTGAHRLPLIPGHEFAGKIVSLGSAVPREYLSRRAAVFPLRPCGKCQYCQAEEYALCDNYNYFGSRCDGGFAEYVAVPLFNLVMLPDTVPFDQGAMCEPAAVALHGIECAAIERGETVLVMGTGTIGLLAALWLRLVGAGRIVCVARNHRKADFLRALGLREVIDLSTEDMEQGLQRLDLKRGMDIVLECTGDAQAAGDCLKAARKGGRIVLYSNPTADVCLARDAYWQILRKQLTLIGTWNSSYGHRKNDWRETVRAMAEKRLNVEPLITHTFPLEEHRAAFQVLMEKRELAVKVMFETEGGHKAYPSNAKHSMGE